LEAGWHLRQERFVGQRDRFYAVMAFARGEGRDPAYTHPRLDEETLCWLGPLLVQRRDMVARADWARQAARLEAVGPKMGVPQQQALRWWKAGLEEFQRPST
jgi:tRNA A22 N-methylase